MFQRPRSMWTLTRHGPITPGVAFLKPLAPITGSQCIARPGFPLWTPYCQGSSQAGFCPCTQPRISDPGEPTFEPSCYLFRRVPPQPNCPPGAVPIQVSGLSEDRWCFTFASRRAETLLSLLPPTLRIPTQSTTPGCSKAPRGLRIPLGVPGLFTRKVSSQGPALGQWEGR